MSTCRTKERDGGPEWPRVRVHIVSLISSNTMTLISASFLSVMSFVRKAWQCVTADCVEPEAARWVWSPFEFNVRWRGPADGSTQGRMIHRLSDAEDRIESAADVLLGGGHRSRSRRPAHTRPVPQIHL